MPGFAPALERYRPALFPFLRNEFADFTQAEQNTAQGEN
jgi:hypothetical protein